MTNQNPVLAANAMVFSHLFHKGKFTVPWHQRRYDWGKESVSILLKDIDEAITEDRKCYFLGSIMLVNNEQNNWEINDGQQRMVTFSLICAYFCRRFQETNSTLYETLALRILFQLSINSTESLSNADNLTPRLNPPKDDQSRYHLMIRGRNIGSNGKLTTAWRELESYFSGMDLSKAKKYFEFLINKVEVACLYIPKSIDPNSVYETINSRGKPLEDFDLIRNYLYSHFNSSKESNRRDTLHGNLERARNQLRGDTRAAEYTRCYLQCNYGFLPKKTFYHEVKNHISSGAIGNDGFPTYVYNLVDELTQSDRVELFRVISNPNTADQFIDQFLKDSSQLGKKRNLTVFLQELQIYTVAKPILFALLLRYITQQIGKSEKKKIAKSIHRNIKNINAFVMRTAFVAPKFESSHYESEFSDIARKIMSETNVYNIQIMDDLKECDSTFNIISDAKFIERIQNIELRDKRRIKRFLGSLNSEIQTDGDLIRVDKCTIEHILPQSSVHWSGWNEFIGEDPAEWVHRIGNLTLLGEQDNKPGDKYNHDFFSKKGIFEGSALELNKDIATDYTDWSPDTITKRQNKLALLAAKVWSFG